MKNTQLHTFLALVSSAFLTACSSGGSGLAQQDTTLDLTASDTSTEDINDAAYGRFFNTALKGQVDVIDSAFNTVGVNGGVSAVAKTIWTSPKAMKLITADFVDYAGIGNPTCDSGSVIRTFTDGGNSKIDLINEEHKLEFSNCATATLNISGTVSYKVTAVNNSTITYTLDYTNFNVVKSGKTYYVSGSKRITTDTATGLSVTSQPLTTFSFNNYADDGSSLGVTTQETSYVSQFTETTNAWDMRLTGSMSFTYGGKTANLVLATATPIAGLIDTGVLQAPTAGEYSITWNSQHLKTQIANNTELTISSDIDANGLYENIADTLMWAELNATIPNLN